MTPSHHEAKDRRARGVRSLALAPKMPARILGPAGGTGDGARRAALTSTGGDRRPFALTPAYQPTGDQPQAIARAARRGSRRGERFQTLLGVTGLGQDLHDGAASSPQAARPALVIAHNKTLAAQLCNEFRELLPEAAVEYFVSYYDYYQPEAYIAATDTYIEKDSSINDEIDRLRHAATAPCWPGATW